MHMHIYIYRDKNSDIFQNICPCACPYGGMQMPAPPLLLRQVILGFLSLEAFRSHSLLSFSLPLLLSPSPSPRPLSRPLSLRLSWAYTR